MITKFVVMWLFHPMDDMCHKVCDTGDDMGVFSQGSDMGFGYFWTNTTLEIFSSRTVNVM